MRGFPRVPRLYPLNVKLEYALTKGIVRSTADSRIFKGLTPLLTLVFIQSPLSKEKLCAWLLSNFFEVTICPIAVFAIPGRFRFSLHVRLYRPFWYLRSCLLPAVRRGKRSRFVALNTIANVDATWRKASFKSGMLFPQKTILTTSRENGKGKCGLELFPLELQLKG